MNPVADLGVSDADLEQLHRLGNVLADALDTALAGWVGRVAQRLAVAESPGWLAQTTAELQACALPALRALLALPVEAQRSTPLTLVRQSLAPLVTALAAAGARPVERDAFSVEAFPDDVFALAPASFAEFGEAVGEAAIGWGAAKAFVMMRSRTAKP